MVLVIILQKDYETPHPHQSVAYSSRDMPVLQFQCRLGYTLELETMSLDIVQMVLKELRFCQFCQENSSMVAQVKKGS